MVADVGGYMGLLLGFSLKSVAEMVEEWWNRIREFNGKKGMKEKARLKV